ncbi:MAG: transcriptional regulator PpsR [Ideonella sp.]
MTHTPGEYPDLTALSAWAPDLAKTFVSLASDIALVIDDDGVIRSVAQGGAEPIAPGAYQWVGRPWIDTVSGETRTKIANLMKEVRTTGIARRREVNHPLGSDSSIPVAYTAIRLGANGPVLAVGRDLRTIAAIQKRYVESQQEMERGYWQARQAEARYQLLFQVATDAVMVVDGQTLQIVEANQAAAALFAASAKQLIGSNLSAGFEHHSRGAVNELLGHARTTGRSGEIRARLQGTLLTTGVVATPFRTDGAMRLLVRMRAIEANGTSATLNRTLARLVDEASDGVVITDSSGRTQIANPAFIALAGLESESQVTGQPLMSWLGMTDQPLAALVSQVRRDGIARHVDSWVKRQSGAAVAVEVAAALLTEGDQERIGFTIRPSDRTEQPSSGTLLRVFRAGISAMGSRLSEEELAKAIREAAALLGVTPKSLELLDGPDTSQA